MERWKVISFNNKYEVSNYGNIRNRKTKKVLKPIKTPSHRQLQIFLYGTIWGHTQYTISQIVFNHWDARAQENPTYYGCNGYKVKNNRIGHRDGDVTNNRIENLYRY